MSGGTAWYIAAGSSYIELMGLSGTRVLSDYFEPRTVIRVEPQVPDEPARYLYIESINDASHRLYFRNSSTTSYIHNNISGGGQYITRYFGTGVNLVGDRTAVFGHNVHANSILGDLDADEDFDAPADFPLSFIVPGATLGGSFAKPAVVEL